MTWKGRYFPWMKILMPRLPPLLAPPPRRAFVMVAESWGAWTWNHPADLIGQMLAIAPAYRWGVMTQWGHGLDPEEFQAAGIETRLWGSCSQLSHEDIASEVSSVAPSRVVVQIEGTGELESAKAAVAAGCFAGIPVEAVIAGWGDFSEWQPGPERACALPGCTRTWVESYPIDQPNQANLTVHLGDAFSHGWPVCAPLVETKRGETDWPLSRYVGTVAFRELGFWRDPVDWQAAADWMAPP